MAATTKVLVRIEKERKGPAFVSSIDYRKLELQVLERWFDPPANPNCITTARRK